MQNFVPINPRVWKMEMLWLCYPISSGCLVAHELFNSCVQFPIFIQDKEKDKHSKVRNFLSPSSDARVGRRLKGNIEAGYLFPLDSFLPFLPYLRNVTLVGQGVKYNRGEGKCALN